MNDDIPEIQLLFSDEFKTRLSTLIKRYRSIRTDLQPLLDELQSGNFIGDQIAGSGFGSHLQIDSGLRGQVLGAIGFPLR